jgi:hypothetical protein
MFAAVFANPELLAQAEELGKDAVMIPNDISESL